MSNRKVACRFLRVCALLLLSCCASAHASRVLVFGDSLSAAYGIRPEDSWVSLLQKSLPEQQFFNASVSGETSSNGLSRLPDALKVYKPDVLVIELGANDGLRGMPIFMMRSNLQAMINIGKLSGCKILLLGMQLPPNYGMRYARDFSNSYTHLAQQNRITVIPFFLQDIANDPQYFQSDQLHPTANAQPLIMATVRPVLLSLLEKK